MLAFECRHAWEGGAEGKPARVASKDAEGHRRDDLFGDFGAEPPTRKLPDAFIGVALAAPDEDFGKHSSRAAGAEDAGPDERDWIGIHLAHPASGEDESPCRHGGGRDHVSGHSRANDEALHFRSPAEEPGRPALHEPTAGAQAARLAPDVVGALKNKHLESAWHASGALLRGPCGGEPGDAAAHDDEAANHQIARLKTGWASPPCRSRW